MRFPTTPGLANANLRTLPRKRVTSWEGCSTRNPTMGILNKKKCGESLLEAINHRIHGAAIYGYMDPINIPPMLVYIPYMDPMGNSFIIYMLTLIFSLNLCYDFHHETKQKTSSVGVNMGCFVHAKLGRGTDSLKTSLFHWRPLL